MGRPGAELRVDGKKIDFCLLFVDFQGIIENKLEVGGRGASRVSLGHKNEGRCEC